MNTLVKYAAGDQEFEQAFFQLAYDKLQGKLYNLLPFLVGFQLVKKSEDSTKAVGVFGFKSNNGQILFVPSFFINGKIKDMDIMYSRNNNQFYPLTEEFAELFLKDDTTGIGTPSDEKREKINKSIGQPNMRDVIYPPRTGRITYASVKEDTEENAEVFKTASEDLRSARDYQAAPSLIEFVRDGDAQIKSAFWDVLQKHASFVDAVRTFYSDEEIADALRLEKSAAEKAESKLKVVDFLDTAEAKRLPESDKKKVARDGYVIVDNRPEHSDVGMFKFTETFGNPTKSGFYPYITELGTIRYGLVLTQPQKLVQGFVSDKAIVVDLEAARKGQCYATDAKKIFVKDNIEIKDLSSALKHLEEPAEGDPSYNDYILINENLACSEPFRILENFKDAAGVRRIKVEPSWYEGKGCCSPCKGSLGKETEIPGYATLILTKRVSDKLEFRNNAVYVPKGFKLFKVHLDTYYSPGVDWNLPEADRKAKQKEIDEEKQRIRMGKPGGLYCLMGLLRERNTFPLTIHTNGSQYFLNVGGAKVKFENPLEAKIAMVAEVGLKEKDAEELLANLLPNKQREGVVKLAVTGDYTLDLQDESPQSNEFGQPTYYGVPWVDSHDRSDGYAGDPTQMGLGVTPDQDAVNGTVDQAVSMAQNGQKEVFDTQAIAALSRYTDTSTKVIEYVPNFVTSLDKLGRMLFLAYWDTEKFEKMYGKDELPELIELVKNVFTNLGDLIIFLKRKVPDISINNNEQAMEQI